jgi:hypothetical protein
MKKYYYTNGNKRLGPFSYDELRNQYITKDTMVWFQGLDKWTKLSEVYELTELTHRFQQNNYSNLNKNSTFIKPGINNKTTKIVLTSTAVLVLFLFGYSKYNKYQEKQLYNEIASSAYETDEDFDFYVSKFYRDISHYGINPKKPKIKIIKFAKLDQMDGTTHFHGLSFGIHDDDKIEIYINPSTWEKFNKPMRYFLIYHELAHDILNMEDLEGISEHEGKLMYPVIYSNESKSMDDFIESSHALFEEVSSNL